jgi:predicted dinucleotide-binding enzyme
MKNTWKGLVVGALTGMVGGAVMDMATGAGRKTAEVAHDVMDKAPSVAKAATHRAADVLHDADVPETVRDMARQMGDSDSAKKVKRVVKHVASVSDIHPG